MARLMGDEKVALLEYWSVFAMADEKVNMRVL